jgi:hypothetical protein
LQWRKGQHEESRGLIASTHGAQETFGFDVEGHFLITVNKVLERPFCGLASLGIRLELQAGDPATGMPDLHRINHILDGTGGPFDFGDVLSGDEPGPPIIRRTQKDFLHGLFDFLIRVAPDPAAHGCGKASSFPPGRIGVIQAREMQRVLETPTNSFPNPVCRDEQAVTVRGASAEELKVLGVRLPCIRTRLGKEGEHLPLALPPG